MPLGSLYFLDVYGEMQQEKNLFITGHFYKYFTSVNSDNKKRDTQHNGTRYCKAVSVIYAENHYAEFRLLQNRLVSKPVKQEVNGTVIFPPLVFPA
jgi:hypothetical protein